MKQRTTSAPAAPKTFGAWVSGARGAAEMNLRQAGIALGISHGQMHNFEHGLAAPEIEQLAKLLVWDRARTPVEDVVEMYLAQCGTVHLPVTPATKNELIGAVRAALSTVSVDKPANKGPLTKKAPATKTKSLVLARTYPRGKS